MSEKTHYRKAFNSPYLSSADIVGPTVLTVQTVKYEIDKTKRSKEYFNTIYFVEKEIRRGEPLKTMILNAGNNEILRMLSGGSKFIEDWPSIPITIYVESNVRFGRDTVDGLRISPQAPQMQKPELTLDKKQAWNNATEALKRDGNLDKVRERMNISKENEAQLYNDAGIERT